MISGHSNITYKSNNQNDDEMVKHEPTYRPIKSWLNDNSIQQNQLTSLVSQVWRRQIPAATMAPATVRATRAIVAAAAVAIAVVTYFTHFNSHKNQNFRFFFSKKKKLKPRKGLVDAIGNTPLIRINSLSEATGCEVSCILDLFLSSSFHFGSCFDFEAWFLFLKNSFSF